MPVLLDVAVLVLVPVPVLLELSVFPEVVVALPVLPEVVVVLLVEEDDLVSSLAAALLTSERNCPALRTDTPLVVEAVRVTRCSNDSVGCWVA